MTCWVEKKENLKIKNSSSKVSFLKVRIIIRFFTSNRHLGCNRVENRVLNQHNVDTHETLLILQIIEQ